MNKISFIFQYLYAILTHFPSDYFIYYIGNLPINGENYFAMILQNSNWIDIIRSGSD